MAEEFVYVLLADDDGTMRSRDMPFGVAVRTEEEAKQYVKDGGVGYTHSYEKLRVFDSAKEGIAWQFPKHEPSK